MNIYKSKKLCPYCHVAFDSDRKTCPECGVSVPDKTEHDSQFEEGEGRRYGAGGEACDYCSHCYGSRDWCPYMD